MFVKERGRKYVLNFIEKQKKDQIFRCWANYNYLKYYWIIDGPRYAVMIVN
jgi:hypothetical protein